MTNQTSIQPHEFHYPFASTYVKPIIRTQIINNEPWFVAGDICNILELTDTRRAVERLDDDERLTGVILHSGQKRHVWLINESGLYNLIFRSSKPEARQFRKWVTTEVLPAIRKRGSYTINKEQPAISIALFGLPNSQPQLF